jgi:chemotaxis methyl-accepting protein methylase
MMITREDRHGLPFVFTPSLSTTVLERRLNRLLVSGKLKEPDLARRTDRLKLLFCRAIGNCPVPLWQPGLQIRQEWRNVTEMYLPWPEIAPALYRLISRSLHYPLLIDPLLPFPSWPEFLQQCALGPSSADPGAFLHLISGDEDIRRQWLFSLFIPSRHGNCFDRYPVQQEFIRSWLSQRRTDSEKRIFCLDAACGSGEGSWDLAALCGKCGILPDGVTIHGSSMDPLELFAASHAYFPHDRQRQQEYRNRIAPVIHAGFMERISFIQEELGHDSSCTQSYDLILCNGLLGGPLLHERSQLTGVMALLVRRLKPGGLMLAADRFHEGWHKLIRQGEREDLLARCGMKIIPVGEGIGAVKGR